MSDKYGYGIPEKSSDVSPSSNLECQEYRYDTFFYVDRRQTPYMSTISNNNKNENGIYPGNYFNIIH